MFAGNIFANGSLSVKFAKIFSSKNFLLYGNYRGLVHMQTFIPYILVSMMLFALIDLTLLVSIYIVDSVVSVVIMIVYGTCVQYIQSSNLPSMDSGSVLQVQKPLIHVLPSYLI